MLKDWTTQYWSVPGTSSSVEKWLDERTSHQFKMIAKEMTLLQRCGNTLRLPHSKALGDGIFELRERFYGYRIYYTFRSNKNIILLHAGDKSSQRNDIKIAHERLVQIQKQGELI